MEQFKIIPEIWFLRILLVLCCAEIWVCSMAHIRYGRRSRHFEINLFLMALSAVIIAVALRVYFRGGA